MIDISHRMLDDIKFDDARRSLVAVGRRRVALRATPIPSQTEKNVACVLVRRFYKIKF